jgi:thiamine biosynthesis lipoprotein
MWQVLEYADWAYTYSGGLIDATVRTALEAHGYDRSFAHIGGTATPTSTPMASWRSIQRDSRTHRVWIPAGVRVDLAGVAKSWAAQSALALLRTYTAAAIDAAGDIVCHGTPPGMPAWPVDIEPLPGQAETGLVALNAQRSIATSGIDKRSWRHADGSRAHHIIDPRSGTPAQSDVVRASVIAPTLIQADVSARMLVIMGSEAGLAWLHQQPECAAMLDTKDGSHIMSPRWHRYAWDEPATPRHPYAG